MPSVSSNLDTKKGQQQVVMVDFKELSSQSNSRSRGGRMDLKGGTVNPIKGANRDQFQ